MYLRRTNRARPREQDIPKLRFDGAALIHNVCRKNRSTQKTSELCFGSRHRMRVGSGIFLKLLVFLRF